MAKMMQMTPDLLMSLDASGALLILTEWEPRRGDHVVAVSAAGERGAEPVAGWDVIPADGDHYDHPAVLAAAERIWARLSAHARLRAMGRVAA